jgi:hypothetical protein
MFKSSFVIRTRRGDTYIYRKEGEEELSGGTWEVRQEDVVDIIDSKNSKSNFRQAGM